MTWKGWVLFLVVGVVVNLAAWHFGFYSDPSPY